MRSKPGLLLAAVIIFLVSTSISAVAGTIAPTVTTFTMPATATELTVSVTSFTATDNIDVTGYMITESSTAPAAGDAGWGATAPISFTFGGYGARTAYAWAKDAAGNVSESVSAAVTIKQNQTITFNPLSATTYGGADFAPGATASSGLTVSYASSNPAVATIVDAQVHITGAGTTDITASQAGDATYEAAADVIRTLTVDKAAQSITFSSPTISKTYGAADFSTIATTSSLLSVTYESSDTAVATANASTGLVHIVGAGTAIITANLAGDANYHPASAQTTLTVDKAVLTVTPQNASRPYGTDNPVFTLVYSGFVNGESAAVLSGAPDLTTTATISSPVGSYPVTAAGGTLAAANYTFSFGTGTLAVDLASQTITFNPLATKTYGDAPFELTATGGASGNPVTYASSDPAVATVSGATVTIVGAGSAVITASQAGDANYASATDQQTLTVDKAVLTVTAENASRPYGTANPAFTPVYSGFVNGETSAVLTGAPDLATTATIASPAGSYPITAAIGTLDAANYTFAFGTGTLAVDLASQTIIFDPLAATTYGDASFDLSATGGASGNPVTFTSSNPAVATVSGATVTIAGVGSATITANQAGNANYASATAQQSLTVNKASLTVTADILNKTYGAANPALTVSYGGFVNGDTEASLSGAPDLATSATAASSVGTYPITVTAGNLFSTNYSFSYVTGTLTVNPADLTVTADSKTRVQGSVNPALTVSYSGFVNGDTEASLTTAPVAITTAITDSPVGTYPITVSGGASGNYSFTYVAGTLTIAKQTQTITFNALAAKTYGDADFAPGATASSGLTVSYASSNPAVATIVGGQIHLVGVGTTDIIASQAGDATFEAAADVIQQLTVNKASLTITADSTSKTYGAANPALTVSYSGFVNDESVANLTTQPTATTTATAGSPAGSYPITAAGGASNNYNFTSVAGTLTVNPAPLTVTADNASKTYGAANPALTVSYSGFVNGDTEASLTTAPVAITTAITDSPVGTYPITVSGGASGNYSFTYVAGTLTIAKQTQTITFNALAARTYGDADFAPGATATSGLTVSYASSNPAVATIVGGQIHIVGAGTTNITASQAGDATFEAAADVIQQLTVNKAPLTVTGVSTSKTYGAANPALTVLYSGFVNGESAANLTTQPTATTTATAGSPAGSYPITAAGGASNNYNFTSVAGTLTVNPAPLTVTADNASKTYGAANPALTVSYSGFVNGDTEASLTTAPVALTTAITDSPVGTYPITVSGGVSGNYSFTYVAGTLTINPPSIMVTSFTMPERSSILAVPVATLTATDTVGVAGYIITESSTAPLPGDAGWTASAPAAFTFGDYGIRTAYAWAKDAAGNVSASRSAVVTISAPISYYLNEGAPQPVGPDGSTNMTATGQTYTVTPLGAANLFRGLGTTAVPTETVQGVVRVNGPSAWTGTDQELMRMYTPRYTNANRSIEANVGVHADLFMSVTGTSASAIATLYEYNEVTGIVGTAKGTATTALDPSSTAGQTLSGTFGNAAFTVANGNRLLVVFSATSVDAGPAYLYGSARTAAPTGYQSISAAEWPVAGDITAPVVNSFSMPATATSLTVNVSALTVSDDTAVTGYMITESDIAPLPDATQWSGTAPATFTFSGYGAGNAYAWAKDAAGNVSSAASAAVTISDATAPTVTAFTMPATATSLTVNVTVLTATDDLSVTGYMITESATAPAAGAAGWSATAPTSFTFGGYGARTAYAWAKDAAGNVSSTTSASVTISDVIAPTVISFALPATATSLSVAVTDFTATDNVDVTGYLVTESVTAPAAGDAGWQATAPSSFVFSASGTRTAYAWAKDAAGNVSAFSVAAVTINLPASSFVVTGAVSPVTAGSAASITVTAKDAFGNTVTGYTGVVHFSSSDPQALLPADHAFVPGDAGVHAFASEIVLKTSGTHSITVTDAASPTITGSQAGIVVNPAQAATLSAAGITTPLAAGAGGSITVTAKDAYGNIATGYTGLVHFISSDPKAILPADYRFVSGDAGVRTLVSQIIFKTSGSHWVTVTDTAEPVMNGTQSGIMVTPAEATALMVTGATTPRAAGTPATMTVTVKDAYGNIATGFTGTLRFTSSDPQAVLPADYTFSAGDAGLHSFSVEFRTVGSHSLTVADIGNGLLTGTQSGISVFAAPADSLTVTGLASPRQANSAGSVTVTAKDAYGNTADGYRGVVHFTSTDPAGVLPADYTFVAGDAGVHTFVFETTLKTVGTHSITATDTATPAVTGTQAGISVIPAQQAAQSSKVAAGASHTVAVNTEGRVFAWGKNDLGQLGIGTTEEKLVPIEVTGVTGVIAIAAGNRHTVALKNDGTVWTWGGNAYGQLGDNTFSNRSLPAQVQGLTGITAIAAGAYHTLALKSDGTVWSWGANGYGQLGDGSTLDGAFPVQVQEAAQTAMIAAGGYHSLFLTRTGTVRSCGANASGQLGNGSAGNSSLAYEISGLSDVKAVAAGLQHSLALKENGTVWSWGDNSQGQLGDGSTLNSLRPVQVAAIAGATGVAGGDVSSVAILKDGNVRAWGGNSYGQLGDGTTARSLVPAEVRGISEVTALSAGAFHVVAVETNGTIWTWGNNANGQLGSGDSGFKSGFVAVTGFTGTSVVAAGASHAAALKTDGTVWAWGKNSFGQLGDGTLTSRSIAQQVGGLSDMIAIAAGANHTVALKGDGTVWAWGANIFGQLGDGTTTDRYAPVQVQGLTGVTRIAAGEFFTLALSSDGTLRAWGSNNSGQLGDGTTTSRTEPVIVGVLSDVTAIAAGYMHSMALKGDGTVWTWGNNSSGQLGDGTTTFRKLPVQASITQIAAIAAGSNHSLARDEGGALWSWGNNAYGQLGDGTSVSRSTPVQPIASGVSAIAAGANHSAALLTDSTVWTWGANYLGQLGDGTATGKLLPQAVESSTSIVAVAAGDNNTLLIKNDGSIWNAGNNDSGQIGDESPYAPAVVPAIILGNDMTPPVTTASLEEGSYLSHQTVALIADEPSTIYFTLDGSVPSTASTVYSEPIPVTSSMVLRFFAVDLAGNTEAVNTRSYEIVTSFPLTIGVLGSGSGRVDLSTGGSCSGSCGQSVAVGAMVSLSAVAGAGSYFAGWAGCDSVTDQVCTVTMSGAKNVTANFSPIYAVSLTVVEKGTVHFSTGETCTGSCVQYFRSGSSVVITAAPDISTVFDGWTGCDSVTGTTCSVSMNGARTVSAIFGYLVKIGGVSYPNMQSGYNALSDNDTLTLRAGDFNESLDFNRDVSITLSGGYDRYYAEKSGQSTIHGSLTISAGTIIVDGIIIQ